MEIMPIYTMKYMFDWGSGVCLWSTNEASKKKYDYPVKTAELPITSGLKERLESLIEKHDEALNWQEPQGELLWSKEKQQAFRDEARQAYEELVQELGPVYEVEFIEHHLI